MSHKHNSGIPENLQKDIRRMMEIRWQAIKSSTEEIIQSLDRFANVKTLEDLALMKDEASKLRDHLQTHIESAELKTLDRSGFVN